MPPLKLKYPKADDGDRQKLTLSGHQNFLKSVIQRGINRLRAFAESELNVGLARVVHTRMIGEHSHHNS